MTEKFLGVMDVDENGTTRLINELQAEVERLKAQAAHLARDRRLLHDEGERLRAELRTCQETLTACLESS